MGTMMAAGIPIGVSMQGHVTLPSLQLKASAGVFEVTGNPTLLSHAAATTQPTVLTQAIVTELEKTDEGGIIQVIAPAWIAIIQEILKDPDAIYRIPSRKWEEIIAGAYEQSGLFDHVTLTPRSGDYGRDIIAERSGWGSVRYIDQVKAYKPGHLVTADEVRALSGVLHADRKANKGIVTTTSAFAPRIAQDPSISPYLPTRIELIDGKELIARLAKLAQ
jgi:restriction system protein